MALLWESHTSHPDGWPVSLRPLGPEVTPRRSAVEQAGLLSLELLLGEDAVVSQLRELT